MDLNGDWIRDRRVSWPRRESPRNSGVVEGRGRAMQASGNEGGAGNLLQLSIGNLDLKDTVNAGL